MHVGIFSSDMLGLNTSLDTDRYSASSFSTVGPRFQVVERAQGLI
jgi:hypothetical protein